MDSRSINVIILPDEETTEKAINLGKLISENFQTDYTIFDRRFIPHTTVYQAQYPTKNYPLIRKSISEIVKGLNSFKVGVGSYGIHVENYIWWSIVKNENLQQLHERVLEKLNPLREGLLLPHLLPDFSGYTSGEKFPTAEESEVVRKYGAAMTGKLFSPHITIGKLKQPTKEEIVFKVLPKINSEFEVSELCIGEMGNYGTVTKILERFNL